MRGHLRIRTALQGYVRPCIAIAIIRLRYGYTRLYTTMYDRALLCTGMHGFVRLCTAMLGLRTAMHVYSLLSTAMHGYVRMF